MAGVTTKEEQAELCRISESIELQATILPIRSVGVQGKILFDSEQIHLQWCQKSQDSEK